MRERLDRACPGVIVIVVPRRTRSPLSLSRSLSLLLALFDSGFQASRAFHSTIFNRRSFYPRIVIVPRSKSKRFSRVETARTGVQGLTRNCKLENNRSVLFFFFFHRRVTAGERGQLKTLITEKNSSRVYIGMNRWVFGEGGKEREEEREKKGSSYCDFVIKLYS